MKSSACALLFALCLLAASPSPAEVFQFFDEEGTLIITDNPYGRRKQAYSALPPASTRISPSLGARPEAAIMEDVRYEYYGVSGGDFSEVLSSAFRNGPLDEKQGRRFPAQTRWNLGWSYDFEYSYRKNGRNLLVSVNVKDIKYISDITVILPALSETRALGPEQQRHWEDFLGGLIEHEHEHVRIIKDSSGWSGALGRIYGIKELVVPFDPSSDTDAEIRRTIEAETENIGRDLAEDIKHRNDEFDRLTKHGLTPR